MKYIRILAITFIFTVIASFPNASKAGQCLGVKPIPKPGCSSVCICSNSIQVNCNWVNSC